MNIFKKKNIFSIFILLLFLNIFPQEMSAIRVDENPIQTCAVETTTAQDTCTKSSEQNQTLNIYALGDLLSFSSLEIKWYQPTPHPPVPQHKLLYPIQLARSHLS